MPFFSRRQGLLAVVGLWSLPALLAAGWLAPRDLPSLDPRPAETRGLAEFVSNRAPWLVFEGDSEQGTPYYLGTRPRDLALGAAAKDRPELPDSLRALGETQLDSLRRALGHQGDFEVEAWPFPHWQGQLNWVFARWRTGSAEPWVWLDGGRIQLAGLSEETAPELPTTYDPADGAQALTLFQDFLERRDLYDKPRFGHAVWTTADGKAVAGAWLPPDAIEAYRPQIEKAGLIARDVHSPAFFNDEPVTFVVKVSSGKITWPGVIRWVDSAHGEATPKAAPAVVEKWPADFDEKYAGDIELLTSSRFARKSSAQADHQLEELVDYLEERYRALDLETRRQRFTWRGIPQSNLIAVIPGSGPEASKRPVLFADHIDTAFSEDLFASTGKRITTAGADDNVTAVAALLRGAELLKGRGLKKDVWILHITGEEFPSDGLGSRHFIGKMLEAKQDFAGMVLIDMIGHRAKGDTVFQIGSGDSAESVAIAELALGAAKDLAGDLTPKFRSRYDGESYLYNTDGILFSHVGYPVVLFNEHINAQNMNHPYYHQSSDIPASVDLGYAATISRVAIETVGRLAR